MNDFMQIEQSLLFSLAMVVYTLGFPAILLFLLFRGHSQNKLQELDFMARSTTFWGRFCVFILFFKCLFF